MTPKDHETDDLYDEAELAEAQALAQALEGTFPKGAATGIATTLRGADDARLLTAPPAELLATAFLIAAGAEPARSSHEQGSSGAVLAQAEEALRKQIEARAPRLAAGLRKPKRKPWWWLLLVPALGMPALASLMLVGKRPENMMVVEPAPKELEVFLPKATPGLVAAQARAVHGSRATWEELERETRNYRAQVLPALAGKEEPQ